MTSYKMLNQKDIKLLLNKRMQQLCNDHNFTVDQVCSMFGVSRSVFYRHSKENKIIDNQTNLKNKKIQKGGNTHLLDVAINEAITELKNLNIKNIHI